MLNLGLYFAIVQGKSNAEYEGQKQMKKKKKTMLNILKISLIMIMCLSLVGCYVTTINPSSKFKSFGTRNINARQSAQANEPRFYAMRGFMGIFSLGMDSISNKVHQELGLETTTLPYGQEEKFSEYLIKEYRTGRFRGPIILAGHSFGADAVLRVARRLNQAHIPVDLVLALDLTKIQTVPPNVRNFYNISSRKSIFDHVLPYGAPLAGEGQHTNIVMVDLVKDKGIKRADHMNMHKLPAVQAYLIDVIKTVMMRPS